MVGGDLSSGYEGVVSVAITGWVDGVPVLRSGARPGDRLWVTGPLGAAAAGLRLLKGGGQQAAPELVAAHARPKPALVEGGVAKEAGATAMIDVSDGLGADLAKLATSSGVGFDLVPTWIPVARGATWEEAIEGGDDYVLAFAAPSSSNVESAFAAAGLPPPFCVGTCTSDAAERSLAGRPFEPGGWEHPL